MLMFDRCQRSIAVVTPVKYEHDLKNHIYDCVTSEMIMEKYDWTFSNPTLDYEYEMSA